MMGESCILKVREPQDVELERTLTPTLLFAVRK